MEKLGKKKGMEDVKNWINSLKIHLYWCAQSSRPGDHEDIKKKWLTAIEHIQNIHVNCLHGDYDTEKKWLTPGKQS